MMIVALLAGLLYVASAEMQQVHPYIPMANDSTNDPEELGICFGSTTTWSANSFAAALRYTSGGACCSASIISLNPGILLSAAHCNGCSGQVRIGCNNPANCDGDQYSIAQFVQNPSYGVGTQFSNDIAIVRLATPITTSGATAINIPSVEQTGGTWNLVGYGITESGSIPSTLQSGSTQVVERTQCNSIMNSLGITNSIDSSMVCIQGTGSATTATSTCSGDSGGPWFSGNNQYGVTSWGLQGSGGGCSGSCNCCSGYPQVGANVANFATWIDGYTAEWTEKYAV